MQPTYLLARRLIMSSSTSVHCAAQVGFANDLIRPAEPANSSDVCLPSYVIMGARVRGQASCGRVLDTD